jgi:DNA-binding MurR/RpiR family transcriptional regulator
VVIIVSYKGGILKEMEMVLPIFKERGCKTVLITSIAPPLGIDYCLRFPAKEAGKGNVATYYSQTCIRLILNCIYGEIFELDYEASRRSKEQAERFNH